jgi:hypothetical protein
VAKERVAKLGKIPKCRINTRASYCPKKGIFKLSNFSNVGFSFIENLAIFSSGNADANMCCFRSGKPGKKVPGKLLSIRVNRQVVRNLTKNCFIPLKSAKI